MFLNLKNAMSVTSGYEMLETGVKTFMASETDGGRGTVLSTLLCASMKSKAERISRRDCPALRTQMV